MRVGDDKVFDWFMDVFIGGENMFEIGLICGIAKIIYLGGV